MLRSRNLLLIACAVLMVFAVLANATMKYYNLHVLIENDRLIAHTHEVKDRLNDLLRTFVDGESSVRGYVISGKNDFLQPHEAAVERSGRDFQKVYELMSDNPPQQASVGELRQLYEQHLAYLREVLATYREQGVKPAHELVQSGRGKTLMDLMRKRVASMNEVEDALLVERVRTAQDRYRQALVAGGVGTLLSLATAGIATIVVWQELRRRRDAEVALKAQVEETRLNAERFRLLTQTVPVCIWISRPDGTVTFLNEGWHAYTGLATDETGCAGWLSAIHSDDVDRLQSIWKKSDGGSSDIYTQEVRVRRGADQTYRWHHCAIVPVRTRRGVLQSWVGSLADIQDQKDQSESLEQAVRLRTQELRRANNTLQEEILERIRAEDLAGTVTSELRRSNEELEKFAYVASHDLQEPLRKIQAFGDRLLRKSRDQLDDTGRGYLDRMLAAATRMRTLIDDLLVFSRAANQTRPYSSVDLAATLADVLGDLESAVQRSQGQVVVGALPVIEADPLQMRQLFQNLIGNALKFAKPGDSPTVTVTATPLANLPAHADPPAPPFSGWRISVTDNGIGFDQIHERRIFELFQRLHSREQFAGTGIGLAICRKIVERHGGTIHARSEVGNGATFHVDLPDAPTPTILPPASGVRLVGAQAASR